MRPMFSRSITALLFLAFIGCGESHETGADAGSEDASADGGVSCGSTTCGAGLVCCNASCGICTTPSGSCPAVECLDGGFDIDAGADGGICTTPILCAAPPDGCRYVNATCTSCGTLDCGGRCGGDLPAVCAEGTFCGYEQGCGRLDEVGSCRLTAQVCPANEDPVCGCDNQTYSNACQAAANGANILHAGACGTGTVCGTIAGITCGNDAWCDVRDCSVSDASGFCQPRPTGCPDVVDPVCGCDNQTYSNACEAYAAGVDVAHGEACPEL